MKMIPTVEQLRQKNDNMIIQFGWDGMNNRRHTKAIEIWFLDEKGKRQVFFTAIPPYKESIYVFDFSNQVERGTAHRVDGLVVISTSVNKSIYYEGKLKYRITYLGLLIDSILSFTRELIYRIKRPILDQFYRIKDNWNYYRKRKKITKKCKIHGETYFYRYSTKYGYISMCCKCRKDRKIIVDERKHFINDE